MTHKTATHRHHVDLIQTDSIGLNVRIKTSMQFLQPSSCVEFPIIPLLSVDFGINLIQASEGFLLIIGCPLAPMSYKSIRFQSDLQLETKKNLN